MLIFFIIVFTLAAIGFIVYAFREKKDPHEERQALAAANLTVADARKNDVIVIMGAGDDLEDMSFTVDRRNRYESGGERWFELGGNYRNRPIFLEVEDDDELICSLSMPDKFGIGDLGIGEDDLIRFDEEEDSSNSVTYNGSTYHYEGSGECYYYKDGSGRGEGYYAWDFVSDDGRESLSIEKWEGEAFECSLSQRVDDSNITVLRN